jgi:hypothetical protein
VQLGWENVPGEPVANVIVPVGLMAVPESLSIAVAVQLVALPRGTGRGAHAIAAREERFVTVTPVVAELVSCCPSAWPLKTAVISDKPDVRGV